MANWCYNTVTYTGRKGNIEKIFSDLERLKQEQIQYGHGVSLLPQSKTNKYMFDLEVEDPTDSEVIIRFVTKWYISIEDFKNICEKYRVNVTCEYEECGMSIYGNYQYVYGGLLDKIIEIPDDVMSSLVEDDDGTVTYDMKTYSSIYEFTEDYLSKCNIVNINEYEKDFRSPD